MRRSCLTVVILKPRQGRREGTRCRSDLIPPTKLTQGWDGLGPQIEFGWAQQDVTRPQLPWVGVRRDALRRWGGHRHREHARCQARGSKRFVSSAWFQALRFTRFFIPAAYRLHTPETARRPTPSHNAELSIAVHRLVLHRSAPPTGVAKRRTRQRTCAGRA